MWSGRDLFTLSAKDWVKYQAVTAWKLLTGQWRYPVVGASGDLETMRFLDIVYWHYKAASPITRAVKGSGLEEFFARQRKTCELPPGFDVRARVTLSAAGDLMDHPFLATSGGHLYEEIADTLFGADISMANLECVVCDEATGTFEIKTGDTTEAPPLYYDRARFEAAAGHGDRRYTLLSTANNHCLDIGERGLVATLDALDAAGIAKHGTNRTEADAGRATVIERSGIRVGVIAHTFGLNAKRPPPDKPWIANRTHLNGALPEVDFSTIERQLADCRAREVDCVIAQLHWGMEHELYPRPAQRDVAHRLAELGCDVILGHHPHVVQPVEYYRTARDPARVVPIYYSLGNLVNPFDHPAFRTGRIAQLQLAKGTTSDGSARTYVETARGCSVFQQIDESARRLRLVPA